MRSSEKPPKRTTQVMNQNTNVLHAKNVETASEKQRLNQITFRTTKSTIRKENQNKKKEYYNSRIVINRKPDMQKMATGEKNVLFRRFEPHFQH